MEKFAFVLHPLSLEDMQMVSPVVRYVPDFLLEYILQKKKPFTVSHITGIKSPYAEAEGWFVGCPLTAKQMVELPEEFVIDRIVETGKIAEELGAKILGLGAFTSIVGDAGICFADTKAGTDAAGNICRRLRQHESSLHRGSGSPDRIRAESSGGSSGSKAGD